MAYARSSGNKVVAAPFARWRWTTMIPIMSRKGNMQQDAMMMMRHTKSKKKKIGGDNDDGRHYYNAEETMTTHGHDTLAALTATNELKKKFTRPPRCNFSNAARLPPHRHTLAGTQTTLGVDTFVSRQRLVRSRSKRDGPSRCRGVARRAAQHRTASHHRAVFSEYHSSCDGFFCLFICCCCF